MSFSHTSGLKQSNRPFKGKSKGKVKRSQGRGRVDSISTCQSSHSRFNEAKHERMNKRKQMIALKRSQNLVKQPLRSIGVISLSSSVNPCEIISAFKSEFRSNAAHLNPFSVYFTSPDKSLDEMILTAYPALNNITTLDLAKSLDVIILAFHIDDIEDPEVVDKHHDHLMSLLSSQGIPTVVGVLCSQSKHQKQHVKLCSRYLDTVLGTSNKNKIFTPSSTEDFRLLWRHCCSVKTKDISWRSTRSYLLAEHVESVPNGIAVSGIVRGDFSRGIQANQLVHVTGLGDFAVQSVQVLDKNGLVIRKDISTFDSVEALESFVPYDQEMEDLPIIEDETELFKPKDHRQAWESELGLEADELEVDEAEDPNALKIKFNLERQEKEFPDEVDTPMDVLARKHFRGWRGLEQFQASEWQGDDPQDIPESFRSIIRFENFNATQAQVLHSESMETSTFGFRVILHIEMCPEKQAEMIKYWHSSPLLISSLFQYEHKVSLCHYRIKRFEGYGGYTDPVESDSTVQIQCGFRRFEGSVIYSKDPGSKGNKYKVEKFLQGDRFIIASVFGRITFGKPSVLLFRDGRCLAEGVFDQVDPDRLLIERALLTGYPHKINKRRSVVRYMFFHPDDVRWFSSIQLWTRYGLQGTIDEPVGTHGLMKCTFDGFIKHHDTVCLSLYKRRFPSLSLEQFA